MLLHGRRKARTGAVLVESAIIYTTTFLLICAIMVGAVGMARYQEVSQLARDGARYASVHGGQYSLDGMPSSTGVAAVASNSDMQSYVNPRMILLNSNSVSTSISWTAPGNSNMPTYADTTGTPPSENSITNYVTVTVSYTWMPEAYLIGPFTLKSTATVAMSY